MNPSCLQLASNCRSSMAATAGDKAKESKLVVPVVGFLQRYGVSVRLVFNFSVGFLNIFSQRRNVTKNCVLWDPTVWSVWYHFLHAVFIDRWLIVGDCSVIAKESLK